MRSELRFVMHPDDERDFVAEVASEPSTVFVNGPSWQQSSPPIAEDLDRAGDYLLIWNSTEAPELGATHHRREDRSWWYCANEYLTIQFLRSGFGAGNSFLIEGRISVSTTDGDGRHFDEPTAEAVERRFKRLRKYVTKSYVNGRLIWQNRSMPRSRTNPLKPDTSLWLGPQALQWLQVDPTGRWVQQASQSTARGYLVDLIQ